MRYLEYEQLSSPYIKSLLKAIETKKNNPLDLYLDSVSIVTISSYYSLKGDKATAFKILDQSIEKYPRKDIFLIQKCNILIIENNILEAQQILRQLENPDSPYALFEHAKIAIVMNELATTRYYCVQILKHIEDRQEFGIHLAFFLATHHKIKEAKDCLRWAKTNYSDKNKLELLQISLDYEEKKFNTAYRLCANLVKREPNNIIIWLYYYSLAFILNKRNPAKAISERIENLCPQCSIIRKINS